MRRALPLVVLLVSGTASAASADGRWASPEGEPTESEIEEARSLYDRGSRAVDQFRFADGLRFFERAYQLSGQGAALFGIGFALQSIGRFKDARDAFNQLLSEHPDLPEEYRGRAEQFRTENENRIAVLSLVGLPALTTTVELDGASVADDGARPLDVETDPGARRLRVSAAGHEPFEWSGQAPEGGRVAVEVQLVPTGGASGETSLFESPFFWIGVGVAVIAAGVVGGVVLYENAQLEPSNPDVIELCRDANC